MSRLTGNAQGGIQALNKKAGVDWILEFDVERMQKYAEIGSTFQVFDYRPTRRRLQELTGSEASRLWGTQVGCKQIKEEMLK